MAPAPPTQRSQRWKSERSGLAMALSALLHSTALTGFFLLHLFAPHGPVTVPTFNLVALEPPKLRPLRPKSITPPPPKPEETRAPEAPRLTPKPKAVTRPRPEPKHVRQDQDTTKPMQDVAKESAQITTTVVSHVPSDPRLSFWARRVKEMVESHWNPPSGISIQGTVKTVVNFSVARDGSISNISVSQGSGNTLLDGLAQQTIQRLDHTPPIPPNFPDDVLQVSYEFVYQGQ